MKIRNRECGECISDWQAVNLTDSGWTCACICVCTNNCIWSWRSTRENLQSPNIVLTLEEKERKLTTGYPSPLEEVERTCLFSLSLPVEETLFHRNQTSACWKAWEQISAFFLYLSPSTGFSNEKDKSQDLCLLVMVILSMLQSSKAAILLTFSVSFFIWPMNNYAKQIFNTLVYSKC